MGEPAVVAEGNRALFCANCADWVGPDHPSPPVYSDHKFMVIERIFLSLDGLPLYCHTCQRTVKGPGGHSDHVMSQIIATAEEGRAIVDAIDRIAVDILSMPGSEMGASYPAPPTGEAEQ